MTEQTKTKRKVNRSAAYPVITLAEAVSLIEMIKNKLGKDNYNRKSLTEALGFENDGGHGARKVAALVHYGLIKRDGNVYSYEDIADRVLLPKSEEEKQQSLVELVKTPKLFNGLINKYEGQALPELLNSVLSRDFNINEKMTKKVALIFSDSIKFAGIYKNGIILNSNNANPIKEEENKDSVDDEEILEEDSSMNIKRSQLRKKTIEGMASLELPCGVVITYPDTLSYNFAMGDFSEVIKKLNDEIQGKFNKQNNVGDTQLQ